MSDIGLVSDTLYSRMSLCDLPSVKPFNSVNHFLKRTPGQRFSPDNWRSIFFQ